MLVKEDVRIQAGERHRGNQPTRKTFRRPAEDTVGKDITPRQRKCLSGPRHSQDLLSSGARRPGL